MPYVVIKTWFPSNKANEVAKIYIEERKKYPFDRSLGKEVVTAVSSDESGIITMGVIDVKEGKLEETLARDNNILVMYLNIEGYKHKVEVWSTAVEALTLLGTGMLVRTLKGHESGVNSVVVSPDGNYIVSGSWDKMIVKKIKKKIDQKL
ncbi:unnamed protein product, partial [marine sediment metagenome]